MLLVKRVYEGVLFQKEEQYAASQYGIRVYIAKITFTTLIDHFTS